MTDAGHLEAAIRVAVQAILDAEGDGWQIAQFAVCMGIERFSSAGRLESAPWVWTPPGQPHWMTTGLIESAHDLHTAAEYESDD